MSAVTFALVLTGVLLNAAAQLLLKAGAETVGRFSFSLDNIWRAGLHFALQWQILLALMFYALSVGVWTLAMTRVQVSIAYPMLSLAYVVTAFAAWWLFGEALTAQKLIGIAIIIVGVIVVARS
ncbi:putative Permease of the drug/metabolite transporter (DMT) superfamily [Thiomonas sp. X19]|uniref:EamA family transporter n=1 Tax=Thiomonas sp. X19 TaxID=1050370 RepID=UPI000B725629|nr:EamA family transporter [Thiomonas sp. X19]SCC94960.1 putative Permease of the drug/metabolite transporter (DMT) superfamily [Thiomonas sp. X19]